MSSVVFWDVKQLIQFLY